MSPEQLQRLSALLDEALDLTGPARQSWLEGLQRDDAELGIYLRDLLARDASGETVQAPTCDSVGSSRTNSQGVRR